MNNRFVDLICQSEMALYERKLAIEKELKKYEEYETLPRWVHDRIQYLMNEKHNIEKYLERQYGI